jgi:hypothetical protein
MVPSPNRVLIVAICVGLFPFLVGLAILGLDWEITSVRSGPVHKFEIPQQMATLDEDLALRVARDALRLDGFDPAEWEPVKCVAPLESKGKRDKFFARNLDPKKGYVAFATKDHHQLFVSVELENTGITSQVSRGK